MQPIKRWITTAALAAAIAACSAPESEEVLLGRASEALAGNQLNAAVIDIKTALQQNPRSVVARRMLAEVYLRQRNLPAAIEELERVISAQAEEPTAPAETAAVVPAAEEVRKAQVLYARALAEANEGEKFFAWHNGEPQPQVVDAAQYQAALARALIQAGDADEAAAQLQTALAAAPDDPYVQISQFMLELQRGAPVEDLHAKLEALLEAHPEDEAGWSLLGDLGRFLGDNALAERAYAKVAELNPFRLNERLNLVGVRIQQGDSEGATQALDALAKVIPDHPGVAFSRGRLLLDEGRYEEALNELNKVLAVLPAHNPSLYLAGMINAREGNLATALRQLQRHLQDNPGNINAREQLANLHLRLDDPRAAETVARSILEENDMNQTALRVLALALSLQGMHAESASAYQQLATLEPEAVDARVGLSNARLLAGDVDAGVEELRAALALDPENPQLHERLVSVYLATGDVDAARSAAAEYLALDPDSVRALLVQGRVGLQADDKAAARAAFERALAVEPGNVNAYGGLAALALMDSDIDTARARFQDALEANPDNLEVLLNLAVLEEGAGDVEAMAAALQRAVDAHPEALAPRVSLARYRLSQEQPGEAVRLLEGMTEANPDDFAMHEVLARAHLANNEPVGALPSTRAMLRLQPDNPQALLAAARVDQAGGRVVQARQHLDKLLEQVPDSVEVRSLLIDNLLASGEFERAKTEIEQLPEDVTARPGVQVVRGRIALAQNEFAVAEEYFASAFEAQRNNIHLGWLAAAQWAQGKQEAVIAALNAWLEEYPEDARTRNDLGSRYLAMGNESAALEQYSALLKIAPDNPLALNNVAWLERERNPQQALEHIRQADRLAPDNAQIKDTYAMVQLATGDVDAARTLIERAAELAPQSNDIALNHAQILLAVEGADRDAARTEARGILERLVALEGFAQAEQARQLLQSATP